MQQVTPILQSNQIWISGNVPSSKNSKQIVDKKKKKNLEFLKLEEDTKSKKKIISSKLVLYYKKNRKNEYLVNKVKFKNLIKDKPFPIRLQFYFIRDSKRDFDYINIAQIVQDIMIEQNWIEDDNARFIIPNFDCGYEVNKDNPGVILTIL